MLTVEQHASIRAEIDRKTLGNITALKIRAATGEMTTDQIVKRAYEIGLHQAKATAKANRELEAFLRSTKRRVLK
jgi:hypothetical protein